MESAIQSSFIPHDAGTAQKSPRARGSSGLNDLLLVLGIIAFVASVALAGAVFLYGQYENSQSASDVSQLQRAEQQFDPTLVQQMMRLNQRMNAGESILTAHTAPSVMFAVLDQITLQSVSFTTLVFDASDPANVNIKMQGVARSVNAIALQDDLMSKSGVFTSPIFSNIDQQKDGVHFDMTADVDTTSLNFEHLTSGAAQQAAAAATAAITGPSAGAPTTGTSTTPTGTATQP